MEQKATESKPVIVSGIQPSGQLALGNYVGAMKNWVKLQADYFGIYIVVDLHAITVRQNPAELRQRALSFAAQYIAAGIDPEKNIIFMQSHVPQHSELAWILNCNTYMGELNRMTQFKDKSTKHEDNINSGLYTYPSLMAADILLYQADLVPVGHDQKQHLELTRTLAQRFNHYYSPTFKVPEPYIAASGARIMSLQDPTKKMSKSDDNPNNYIALLDEPSVILKKIKRAVTDSGTSVTYDAKNRPGLANLLTIYSVLGEMAIDDVITQYDGKGFGVLKEDLGNLIVNYLTPFQRKYKELMSEKNYLESILKESAAKAQHIAQRTLSKVHRKVGFVQFK
jgi:tryptophanyl-tRNA synthetase